MEDRQNSYVYRELDRVKKLVEENHYELNDFRYGEEVIFEWENNGCLMEGTIYLIDKHGGGLYCGVCPSFDIMVGEGNNRTLYKHVPIVDVRKKDEYNGSFVRNKCDEEMLEKRKTFPKLKDILE